MPMTIAFYAPLKPPHHPTPSGDRKMARQLVAALEAGGHRVEVASSLRMYRPIPHEGNDFETARQEARSIIATWERQGERPADLWFSYHPYYKAPDVIGPIVSRHFAIPYVTAEASYAGKRERDQWRHSQAIVADALRLAWLNFCFTADDAEGLSCIAGAERVAMLAPFIETERAATVRAHKPHAPLRLVTVAMMRPGVKIRSYRFLAAALARLDRLDWRLRVAGDGPDMAEVKAAFAGFAEGRVDFLGELAHKTVAGLIDDSDIFVWPGFGEAYGLAYLEAQAAGVPAVGLATHGVPSVIDHGKTGLLVSEEAPEAFAAGIARIARDPALYERLSTAAHRFVAEERSLAAAARLLNRHLAPLVAPESVA